ncbi:MAG: diguanylate cyclase, partial [Candidatus Omnitrophica bacterium]|nr:diguanylate cyclase [Candidatus Omnitrophota bacterium]
IIKRRPFLSKGRMYKMSFSAGIAAYPNDGRETDEIIHKADKAMYFSKAHGRGKVTIYSHILHKTVEKILGILMGILSAAGALWYFNQSPYKNETIYWLKQKTGNIERILARRAMKIDPEDLDLIYLKSGRILRGTIVREDKDEIELSLSLESGRGAITLKRPDISRIMKWQAKSKK